MSGICCFKSSRVWRFTDFLPRSSEYGRVRRGPRQRWWAPVKSGGRWLRPSPSSTLSRRRCAHRRSVDGSGERDGSLQCEAACSTESPAATFSHACCRQRKVKGAEGTSQSAKIVKVLLHG